MPDQPRSRSADGPDATEEGVHRTGLDLLSDAATEVVGAPDPLGVLESVSRLALKLVGARGACAHLFEHVNRFDEAAAALSAAAGELPPMAVGSVSHVESVRDRLTGPPDRPPYDPGAPVVVPLTTSEGRTIGGMCLWAPTAASAPAGDVVFSQLLRLAGVALEKATRLEHEHRLVLELQRSLLPRTVPAIPGVRVSARYRPASVGVDVGGDWYDIFALPAGKFAFVLGDVAGHGVHAASVMGQVRMALRAYAMETDDPTEVVTRLNRLMTQLHTSEFTTLILCIWDPPTRTARIVRAGHLQPVLIDGGGATVLETAGSVPIGVDVLSTYSSDRVVVAPGSALLLFSDGLVERRGESLDVGIARLTDLANDFDGDLDVLCDRLLANLTGQKTEDDVAVLGILAEATPAGRITFDLTADLEGLSEIWERFIDWLVTYGASEREIDELVAMVQETCVHAIERSARTGRARLRIEAAVVGGLVDIMVQDIQQGEEEAGRPQRRGLALMRSLSDAFEVRRHGRGTAIVIRRRIREH